MDMYQKRKMRQEKKNNPQEEKLTKVGINWYPGHMAKTRRQIESDIKIVDIVIELLDARIPISSQNPDIAQIISKKKKIVVLNKGDLADDNKNKQWLEYFQKREIPANMVWLWGQGVTPKLPSFKETYGLDAAVITGVDLLKGIGVFAGMEIVDVPGATGFFDTDYESKGKCGIEALKNNDVLFIHI